MEFEFEGKAAGPKLEDKLMSNRSKILSWPPLEEEPGKALEETGRELSMRSSNESPALAAEEVSPMIEMLPRSLELMSSTFDSKFDPPLTSSLLSRSIGGIGSSKADLIESC